MRRGRVISAQRLDPAGGPHWRHSPLTIVLAGGVIVLISMGLRQSFGIFMQPLGCVLGIDRESFGLAIALQNLLLLFLSFPLTQEQLN